ncbi:hypothetical protein F8M41_005981 [Gigaspora margarita]|uniref:Uncharacterized protein n=1 Tax=Gigaspora margarita TaxID=4874 RepID=A0A8H4A5N5_GIGMA|nr:hypothetical protein F8M41_005981 [Gigaspora margarita]
MSKEKRVQAFNHCKRADLGHHEGTCNVEYFYEKGIKVERMNTGHSFYYKKAVPIDAGHTDGMNKVDYHIGGFLKGIN